MKLPLLATNDPLEQSIASIGLALRQGDLSCVALTERALARAAQVEPELNAFIEIAKDRALEQAQTLDREAARAVPRRTRGLRPDPARATRVTWIF